MSGPFGKTLAGATAERRTSVNTPLVNYLLPPSRAFNTVHDSIVLDVYPDEEQQAITTLKEAMMALSEECEKRYGFKYTMPIGIELKLGNDWLNMMEVYKTNG